MDIDKIKYNDNYNKLAPRVQRKMKKADEELVGKANQHRRIHFDHFSGMSFIGGREWYIWSDGTKHRFKEKMK